MTTVAWTDHALLRAKERGPEWGLFRALVERMIESREWEEWFEYDDRPWDTGEPRGLRRNMIVRVIDGTAAVVRMNGAHYLVVSVLTAEQYAFNADRLWSKTEAHALARRDKKERDKAAGLSSVRTLTYSPFAAALANKKLSK